MREDSKLMIERLVPNHTAAHWGALFQIRGSPQTIKNGLPPYEKPGSPSRSQDNNCGSHAARSRPVISDSRAQGSEREYGRV